jgi:hypothetical protein
MRILAVLAVLATAIWCGYWVVGSRALDRVIGEALVAVPEVSVEEYAIRGFPNRFDVTLTQPRVDVDGWRWTAPFVQFFALTYKPHHLLAVFAHDQALADANHAAVLHSDDLRASLVMEPSLALPLERFTLVGTGLELQLDGDSHRAEALRAASRRITATEHDLVFLLDTVFPDPAVMDRLDPEGIWPRRYDILRLDARAETDRPLDRHLMDGVQPHLVDFAFTGLQVFYDGVEIVASGALRPDAEGRLSGDVTLSVTGWRDLMRRARDAGLMPDEHDALVSMALQGLTTADNPERIEAAFSISNGVIRMGPLTLGQLPPLF